MKCAHCSERSGPNVAPESLRNRILRDFAAAAYSNNILMLMDISVYAFHNNAGSVCKILNDVVKELMSKVR